jgi:hypothetical protein
MDAWMASIVAADPVPQAPMLRYTLVLASTFVVAAVLIIAGLILCLADKGRRSGSER